MSYDRVTVVIEATVRGDAVMIHPSVRCFAFCCSHLYRSIEKNTNRFLFAFNRGRCGLCLRYLTGSSCRLLGLFHPIHATLHARNGILCHGNVRRRLRQKFPCSQKVAACSSPAFNLRLPSLSGPCFLLRENLSCSARKLSAIALFRHFGKLNSFSHYFRNPRSSACHPRHHVLHFR